MTRYITAVLFVFLGLNISSQASGVGEPSNLGRASVALRILADEPTLERLTTFNKLAGCLTDQELGKLNLGHSQKVIFLPLGYKLYGGSHPMSLGMIPAIQEEVKQSLILWAKLLNLIEPHMKDMVLDACFLYRAWYNTEKPDASAAIKKIRAHYRVEDKTTPVWQLYLAMPLEDKLAYHLTTMYSLPASNVYIRWTTVSFLALLAAYVFLK